MSNGVDQLVAGFLALGINQDDAASFADAQVTRGKPQVSRVVLQMALWRHVVDGSSANGLPKWMDAWLRASRSAGTAPDRGVPAALHRMLEAGVAPEDLTEVVRAMQAELLYGLAATLDCEGVAEIAELLPEWATYGWKLFALDEQKNPAQPIESLGETLEGFDPDGFDSVFGS